MAKAGSNASQLDPYKFKKGQSGNPAGVSSASRELTKALEGEWPVVFRRLMELLRSDNEKVSSEVVRFCVDHIKGKPKQTVTGEDGAPLIDLGVIEMLRKLAAP